MKIIVVDDEMSALHVFLTELIGKDGIEYKFFKDNENEILSYLVANKIDAAFLDIGMPNINGITLAEKLIKKNAGIKIVFTTGLTVDKDDLPQIVKANTLGFVYKPYDNNILTKYLSQIANQTPIMTVKMFGSFDCFIGDKIVNFSSNKSKELFALLLTYDGKGLTMNDAISQLWADHDLERAKKLYRDAVWRLRKTLEEINFNCVNFGRAQLAVVKDNISCDYWDYLKNGKGNYNGEFLKTYEWSIPIQSTLDTMSESEN
jgi:two-component SAPR family response regulator